MIAFDEVNRTDYATDVLQALKQGDKKTFRELFLDLHPTNQLEIFVQLNRQLRQKLYELMTGNEFAEVFIELELEKQKLIINELTDQYMKELFDTIPTDDVADFLAELDKAEKDKILHAMAPEREMIIRELLSYPIETAGGLMAKEFITVSKNEKVSEVIDNLRFQAPDAETIYYLYVLDEQSKLVGVVSLRDLIISPAFETIDNIMGTDIVSVTTEMDQEEVYKIMKRYDFLAVPVVTKKGELTGIITIDDMMHVMEEEVNEDFDEFIAAKGGTDINISSFAAAKKRAPWIVMLIFFGFLTGGVIGSFEEALEEMVILAVFIPLIMDSAGNAGTQSLAVVVRAIATDSFEKRGLLSAIRRELGTGLLLGAITGTVLLIVIPIVYGSFALSLIVASSLFITLSFSTITGAVVPVIITKLKLDPAIASGPFITTLNDILGLIVYFTIATTFMAYL
ncbi:magnesium transporter MgtE [Halolactibacillus alkaliphilus]|uniref:Magnesium transporter MgtE n=1 Tax=Halolactibacillus alkaliphilus TaxID=442899 RepID=A0A511X078_9BACI|nr:magnesium transporter [Halolactibacillus alkaliphilus]GEN56352.1 magnesium transporter MgtE [Halolactibacillus alkaliphilus]GGN67568.1 magnesium transporter MgtE [Halolactibacillus alkaliphilus]SFO78608.1 magnesium transporter [Halolactibacillus alkaliphilus]